MAKEEHNFEIRQIDNSDVRRKQIERIKSVKASRDSAAVAKILA
jgi:methylmalonyl-CoA mutase